MNFSILYILIQNLSYLLILGVTWTHTQPHGTKVKVPSLFTYICKHSVACYGCIYAYIIFFNYYWNDAVSWQDSYHDAPSPSCGLDHIIDQSVSDTCHLPLMYFAKPHCVHISYTFIETSPSIDYLKYIKYSGIKFPGDGDGDGMDCRCRVQLVV